MYRREPKTITFNERLIGGPLLFVMGAFVLGLILDKDRRTEPLWPVAVFIFSILNLFPLYISIKNFYLFFKDNKCFTVDLRSDYFEMLTFENSFKMIKKRYNISEIRRIVISDFSKKSSLEIELLSGHLDSINLKYSFLFNWKKKDFLAYLNQLAPEVEVTHLKP